MEKLNVIVAGLTGSLATLGDAIRKMTEEMAMNEEEGHYRLFALCEDVATLFAVHENMVHHSVLEANGEGVQH